MSMVVEQKEINKHYYAILLQIWIGGSYIHLINVSAEDIPVFWIKMNI